MSAADIQRAYEVARNSNNPQEKYKALTAAEKALEQQYQAGEQKREQLKAEGEKLKAEGEKLEAQKKEIDAAKDKVRHEKEQARLDLPLDWTANKYCVAIGILAFSTAGVTVWDIIKRKETRDRTYSADGEPVKTNVFVTAYTIVCCFIAAWGIFSALGALKYSPTTSPHFYQKFWLVLQILACQCMIRSRIESISNPDSDESHKTEKRFVLGSVWVGLFVLLMYKIKC